MLTNAADEFRHTMQKYLQLPVQQIDIDIATEEFVGNQTLQIQTVLDLLAGFSDLPQLGFHLMLGNPEIAVAAILASRLRSQARIYLHLESDYAASQKLAQGVPLGLVIKAETQLPEVSVLAEFDELQFMTIQTGKQGNPFLPQVKQKIAQAIAFGYGGKISIDGGVNQATATEVSTWPIHRVSVGSYFQTAADIQLAYQTLSAKLMTH